MVAIRLKKIKQNILKNEINSSIVERLVNRLGANVLSINLSEMHYVGCVDEMMMKYKSMT